MSEGPGRLLERSPWPILTRILIAGVGGLIFCLVLFVWLSLKFVFMGTIQSTKVSIVLVIGAIPIDIAISAFCMGWISYNTNIILYDNGFIPNYRPFRTVFSRTSYFIPFQGIDKIAVDTGVDLDGAKGFYILHKDGTISVHHREQDPNQEKVWKNLIFALKTSCPSVEIVKLIGKVGDGGIDLEKLHSLSANDRGRNIQYKTQAPF